MSGDDDSNEYVDRVHVNYFVISKGIDDGEMEVSGRE